MRRCELDIHGSINTVRDEVTVVCLPKTTCQCPSNQGSPDPESSPLTHYASPFCVESECNVDFNLSLKSTKCIGEEINGQHFQKKVDTLPAALFICEKRNYLRSIKIDAFC